MSIAIGIITTVCVSRERPVARTRICTGYEEREMIIDLSLWACQITGLGVRGVCVKKRRDIYICERLHPRLVYSCIRVHTRMTMKGIRSGGNGSARIRVRVCFAPE